MFSLFIWKTFRTHISMEYIFPTTLSKDFGIQATAFLQLEVSPMRPRVPGLLCRDTLESLLYPHVKLWDSFSPVKIISTWFVWITGSQVAPVFGRRLAAALVAAQWHRPGPAKGYCARCSFLRKQGQALVFHEALLLHPLRVLFCFDFCL